MYEELFCEAISYDSNLTVPNPIIPYYFYVGQKLLSNEDIATLDEFQVTKTGQYHNSGNTETLPEELFNFFSDISPGNSVVNFLKVTVIALGVIKTVMDIFDSFDQKTIIIIKAAPKKENDDENYQPQVHADPCFESLVNANYYCTDKYAVTLTLSGQPTYYFAPTLDQAISFDAVTNGGNYNYRYNEQINQIYSNSTPAYTKVGEAMVFKIGKDGAHHTAPNANGMQRIWVGLFPIDPCYAPEFEGDELEKLLKEHRDN